MCVCVCVRKREVRMTEKCELDLTVPQSQVTMVGTVSEESWKPRKDGYILILWGGKNLM